MRRDRIARARYGLRRVLWACVQIGRRPDGPGFGATRSLAAVQHWPCGQSPMRRGGLGPDAKSARVDL